MKSDIFQNMGTQMTPKDEMIDELLQKIHKLPANAFPKRKWRVAGLAAACVVLAAAAVFLLPAVLESNPFHTASLPQSFWQDAHKIPSWEERSLPSQFDRLMIDDHLYLATERTVTEDKIGDFLFKTTMTGYDYTDMNYYLDIEKAKQYKKEAEVYALQSIGQQCMVAVKYEGQENYYSFTWNSYIPDSLGGFIDSLHLREYLIIETILYDGEDNTRMEYTLPSYDKIWEFLMENKDAAYVNPASLGQMGGEMGIKVSMDMLPQDVDTFIGISRSGYLFTNLFSGTMWAFHIGEEKTNDFIDYVLYNGTGKKAG